MHYHPSHYWHLPAFFKVFYFVYRVTFCPTIDFYRIKTLSAISELCVKDDGWG